MTDDKQHSYSEAPMNPCSQRKPRWSSRPRTFAIFTIAASLVAWELYLMFSHASPQFRKHEEPTLVPLEAHIMSKCPDTRDCLHDLILPTMQRVFHKVNFTMSFVGTPTENDGIECKHGPAECMGNILELCAAELYPDPKTYLGFTMCITKDYKSIPDRPLIEDCALEHAIDIKKLNDCAAEDGGAHGLSLLRNSVRRSDKAGVTKSCTVRLNNEVYCSLDDGEWRDCPSGHGVNDLVIAIEKLYRS